MNALQISDIHIAAAVMLDPAGRMLLVRKHGSPFFQQPGGKIERGETPEAAVIREVAEELGIMLPPKAMVRLGLVSAPAANEAGMTVIAHLFAAEFDAEPQAAREIAEIGWWDRDNSANLVLAPLTETQVVPLALTLVAGRDEGRADLARDMQA